MKADVWQQHSLLKLVDLDAELTRLAHRSTHLPEQQDYERIEVDQVAAGDRLAALQIALEDLDAQVARLEAEIDAVRQREERDRGLLDSGITNSKQVADLQHELETLERRQASLEDSQLELMEQRERLQADCDAESAVVDGLQNDLSAARQARDGALADIENTRGERSTRRDELAASIDAELLALYERQRAQGGVGAGQLRGTQCGACRIEIDRGQMARISAAPADDVLRCPECNAILLRVKDSA
ncbi:zinc ribbon domain-containing protein [Mycobacterium sp. M1]|uniref:Zinc ribbon domain-containing protein n=1 Tax=Mycolicibacter acidiphilus TaxID=2835306 RepID=A0ABS5RHV7_9MYCO|nr:zinc ribbon domain-containing protein [Mycolicibacter acidiphilus]MBS9533592.1 zinc ribbon domain-containing protein [Mycolicibacter acidiphilus]